MNVNDGPHGGGNHRDPPEAESPSGGRTGARRPPLPRPAPRFRGPHLSPRGTHTPGAHAAVHGTHSLRARWPPFRARHPHAQCPRRRPAPTHSARTGRPSVHGTHTPSAPASAHGTHTPKPRRRARHPHPETPPPCTAPTHSARGSRASAHDTHPGHTGKGVPNRTSANLGAQRGSCPLALSAAPPAGATLTLPSFRRTHCPGRPPGLAVPCKPAPSRQPA
jgi:hypothetical protein